MGVPAVLAFLQEIISDHKIFSAEILELGSRDPRENSGHCPVRQSLNQIGCTSFCCDKII
jgi:hypothetical protein